MPISPDQARAARAHCNLNLKDVESATGITSNSLSRFEADKGGLLNIKNSQKLKGFYESLGIEFIDRDGICSKLKSTITQLEGQSGFIDFMKDVSDTIEKHGGEICVSGVDERLFEKWQGDYAESHIAKMTHLQKTNGFKSKIIVKEGDHYYQASNYAEYRHVNEQNFASAPFYVYDNKLAMIIFEKKSVTVYIIDNNKLADGQRKQFNILWKSLEV